MSRPLSRIGDRTWGRCYHPDHANNYNYSASNDIYFAGRSGYETGGTIITGSPNSTINNRAAARLGDLVQADCGHISRIITSDGEITENNRGQARVGDRVGDGPYEAVIITGSADTNT